MFSVMYIIFLWLKTTQKEQKQNKWKDTKTFVQEAHKLNLDWGDELG